MKTKLNAPRSVGSTSSAAASTDRSGRAASSAVTNAVSEVTPGSARPSSATRRASSAVLTRLPLCARAIVMPAHCSAYGVERSVGCAFSVPDWGTSYAHCVALGERAAVVIDTGHHAPGTNIEFIVAFLLGAGRLGGF